MADEREIERAGSPEPQSVPGAADEPVRSAIVEPPEPEVAAEPLAGAGEAAGEPSPMAPAETASESAPAVSAADDSEGFFARLRTAFKGFFRGLRGLPVEIPPGEEGTVPVVEAAATQRKLEKRLAKAQAKIEELRESLEKRKLEVAERDAGVKEAQRELKRVRAESADAEAALRKEAEKAQEIAREKEERIQHLQNEVAGREARLAQRDADLEAGGRELEDLRRTAAGKERELDAQVAGLREQLDARSAELARTEEARASAAAERDAAARRGEAQDQELARWRLELTSRDDVLADLRAQLAAAAARSQAELDEARGELEFTKSTLAEKESAMQLLLGEVKNQEEEADREHEEASQKQAQLTAEIEEGRRKLAEASALAEKLRAELIAALPERAEFDSLKVKAAHLERELARKSEEAGLLRDDMATLRKRAGELDERARKGEEADSQKAAFQREIQRQGVQIDALREQFTEAQLKVEKLGAALKEFHAPTVSAIQMATVYAESLAASLAMNESDRSDAQDIKKNMEQLRQTMQKLSAKLAELGVPHS